MEEIAQCDDNEVVHNMQEYFADYFPITKDTFNFNIPSCIAITPKEQSDILTRICDGLSSVLISLKKKPLIRYDNNSALAQRVAQELTVRFIFFKLILI